LNVPILATGVGRPTTFLPLVQALSNPIEEVFEKNKDLKVCGFYGAFGSL